MYLQSPRSPARGPGEFAARAALPGAGLDSPRARSRPDLYGLPAVTGSYSPGAGGDLTVPGALRVLAEALAYIHLRALHPGLCVAQINLLFRLYNLVRVVSCPYGSPKEASVALTRPIAGQHSGR